MFLISTWGFCIPNCLSNFWCSCLIWVLELLFLQYLTFHLVVGMEWQFLSPFCTRLLKYFYTNSISSQMSTDHFLKRQAKVYQPFFLTSCPFPSFFKEFLGLLSFSLLKLYLFMCVHMNACIQISMYPWSQTAAWVGSLLLKPEPRSSGVSTSTFYPWSHLAGLTDL